MTTVHDSVILEGLKHTPRNYQVEGALKLAKARSCILADDPGIGKTGEALLAWRMLGCPSPLLIIARPNAQATWIRQAPDWGVPYTIEIVKGTARQRQNAWSLLQGAPNVMGADIPDIVTTSVESLRIDAAIKPSILPKKFGCIIYDEYQRALINRKNLAVKLFQRTGPLKWDNLFLLSGTPVRKGFQDLWTALHICAPRDFPSYWRYVNTFGITQLDELGHWEILGLNDRSNFMRRIDPWFIRREKKDVAPELPPKQRIMDHALQMQPQQRKLYEDLAREMLATLPNDDIVIARNELAKLTKLRQILTTPKILDPDFPEYGASIEHLGELLEETSDHHFVVFTPFTGAIPHIHEYLRTKIGPQPIIRLQGGLSPQEVNDAIDLFREERGIAICSTQYAESFELVPAKWAYNCHYSWSVVDNIQAEDRLHRLTTLSNITYYYPFHEGCIDEELMIPILDQRAIEVTKVYQSARRLREMLLRSLEPRPT